MFLAWTLLALTTDMSEIFIALMFTVCSSFQSGSMFFHLNEKHHTTNLGIQSPALCAAMGSFPFALSITNCTTACEILQSCWLPGSPALEKHRPRALWLLLTECHDPQLSAFALTGGFEIPGLKVLWDYISEGICDDGSWQVLLSRTWRNSAGCRSCRELRTIRDAERKCCFIPNFFKSFKLFPKSVNYTHDLHDMTQCVDI